MAKPKKGAKVKNQTTKKAAPPQTPPSPPRPATPPPPPPTMLSKNEQVRAVWKDFFASWYTPEAVSYSKDVDAIDSNILFTTDSERQDERLRLDESLRDRAKTEWERRLEEKGLREADWIDITPPEMVVTFKVLFGVEVSEEDVVKHVQPEIQPPPQPEPTPIIEPSPSPSTPVASSSSQKLPIIATATRINPSAPLTTEVRSTNLSTSAYAIVNPASFGVGAYDEDDDEDADGEAGFDLLEAFDTDSAVSPTSSQSTTWWNGADSLQTSPSTSPSSKPVVVDYPTPEDRFPRTMSVSPPRQVPVELWKPPAPESVTPSSRNPFASPISSDEDVSKISEWFEALKSEEDPPKVQLQRGVSDTLPSERLDTLRIETEESFQRRHDQTRRVRQAPQLEPSCASPPIAHFSVPPLFTSALSAVTAAANSSSSSRSKQTTRYIGPVIVDPHDYGLLHPQEKYSAPERSLKQMENEFEEFKMSVRFKMIEEFHMDAIKHERTLVQDISQGEDPTARMVQHEVRMLQLQRDKEDKRKKLVDEERQKRRREIREKDEEAPKAKALEAFKREQEMARRKEQAKREEERRKEEDLQRREEEMRRRELEIRRKEEEMKERERLEREQLEFFKREHASKKKAEERAKRERVDRERERELRAAQELSDREVAMKLQEKLSREVERARVPEKLSREMLTFAREQERVREKRRGEVKLSKEMETFLREQEKHERERQEREARLRRKDDERAKEGGEGKRAKDVEEAFAREQEKTREHDRQRSHSRLDDFDTTLRPNEHLYWRPSIASDKGIAQHKKSQPSFFESDPIERPPTTSGWKVKSSADISKVKALDPPAARAVVDESRTKTPRSGAVRHESTASLPVVDISRMRPQSQASVYHHPKSSSLRSLEAENSSASSSKLTLDHMREPLPPPKLTSSSTSQKLSSTTPLPDNRTIWLPKAHHESRDHMSRSTVIEKTQSMPETHQVHVRARTTSDPSPPTPVVPPKPLAESRAPAKSKGKTNVMLEEVPDDEDIYSDKDVLPADSTAIMLSNLEPEAPRLVDAREKRVRWTESVSGGSPMSDATVLPAEHGGKARMNSVRPQAKWGETARKGVEDWRLWTVPTSSM
ncbi:uncharacterized protein BT62DRAFT_919332 [Guyanagaster necrorhizus]|uniref:Uncharacterized protein n=1 Tax=Guyanagaster necrorhizus TaxID=856835 RepID=A0A9P7VSN4_9AGAR|nr:uncharacterized protein BT62DRAFT_919332 [Guyanagaster necrorhizus MCA 3950]KAG7446731.1 hypothetical protein BT62DRAFT_919332 [Guyanagaster necrorhizus MCA 3950]